MHQPLTASSSPQHKGLFPQPDLNWQPVPVQTTFSAYTVMQGMLGAFPATALPQTL